MSISMLDAMKLNTFQNFRLIAGHRGLEKRIESVGILDYEFAEKNGEQLYEGQFLKNEFVITSLLFAKDNPSLVLTALQSLVEDGISGLAIKNIYFKDLSEEVIEYANKHSLPIFIFDNRVYFENIITEISDRIKFVDDYNLLETKISILLKKNISKELVRELALEINDSFKNHLYVIYCKEKRYLGDDRLIALASSFRYNKMINKNTSILKYRDGILIIHTFEQMKNFKSNVKGFLEARGFKASDYNIGISRLHDQLGELSKAIHECLFASKANEISTDNPSFYDDIGILKALLPVAEDESIKSYYRDILEPINEYDKSYNGLMFRTAMSYIENDGVMKKTADALFIHENTIRYRINKLKEILGMENSEGNFYEQLSIAMKLHKIYEKGTLE